MSSAFLARLGGLLPSLAGLCGVMVVARWMHTRLRAVLGKGETNRSNYRENIGHAYDDWTQDGVLERLWGEHIHHGYYGPDGKQQADFIKAKEDMIWELLAWAKLPTVMARRGECRVLDAGCGFGGSSRFLARTYPRAQVTGITLSPVQRERAEEKTRGDPAIASRVTFKVADALNQPFPDNSFDVVWSLESGEHMPDKEAFVRECHRVLKPGGQIIIVTWCHRPLGEGETLRDDEQFLLGEIYREWELPFFCSIEDYRRIFENLRMANIKVDDWSAAASPTWWHCITEGARNIPFLLRAGFAVIWRSLRDVYAIYYMIRGYNSGTIRYGLITASKAD